MPKVLTAMPKALTEAEAQRELIRTCISSSLAGFTVDDDGQIIVYSGVYVWEDEAGNVSYYLVPQDPLG